MVIFSANYAFSKWCLMELAEILEWEEKKKLTILPIFYHVDPSDMRNQSGSFAEAFTAHEKDPKIDKKDMDSWRNALRKAGSIAGWHIHNRYESTIIQEISRSISRELNSRFSRHDYDKLVAIDSQVDEMMKLLDLEPNDVRFVGIHGMGGIETTLAEIIYDRVSSCRFEGSSFISCIREKSTTARDLASLQKELLSTIMQEEIHVWDHHQGIRMIMKMLQNKKVFIVLDDVDSEKQLKTLAGDQKWFGPGSRVIITCRDSHLLRTHGVYDIYKFEQLQTAEALQLFSLSAFKKAHPTENYMDLSMDFVNYTQGLPLALKVLGSFLYEREIDHGVENIFYEMLLESFGHYRIDIDVLVEKSLVSKSKYGWLSMHDLLKELGREIVRQECPEELGRRSRLFRVEDLYHVLKNDTGTDAIEGIVLDFCPEMKERLNAKTLSTMRKLRYFEIHHSRTIKWHGDPLKYMPTKELRFLEWSRYHLKSFPSSFQPKILTVLRMSGIRIKQLWKGSMVLDNLKEFDLSYSQN
ncbi:hypothetical protein F2P56_019660 [Juglans regia]|nr:hypothetical protein F2P56_019660 [Juglans regia]